MKGAQRATDEPTAAVELPAADRAKALREAPGGLPAIVYGEKRPLIRVAENNERDRKASVILFEAPHRVGQGDILPIAVAIGHWVTSPESGPMI